jgi:cytochrome c oxidase subunit II
VRRAIPLAGKRALEGAPVAAGRAAARSRALLAVAAAVGLWALPPAARADEPVIQVKAKKFEFLPPVIELKKGQAVVLEFVALDRKHGVKQKELGLDLVVEPGKPARARLVPEQAGEFEFACSVFCGSGHEEMTGKIVVKP